MGPASIMILILAIVAIAAAAWVFIEKHKTRKLKQQFGPEYDRVMDQEKNLRRGEAVLGDRQKRVEQYHIRALTREERDTFAAQWRTVQEHFVDDPREAIGQADSLVAAAMRTRGYPMSDFEQRAADLSVDHPAVVQDYRIAHDIALRDARSPVSTEDLRMAVQHFRTLFEHVLDTHVLQHHS